MRLNRWVCAAGSFGMIAMGAFVEQACDADSNYCTTSGGTTTCYLYNEPPPSSGTGSGTTMTSSQSMVMGDGSTACVGDSGGGVAPFGPGDGGACGGPVGGFPASNCDPSDESASGCQGPLMLAPGCTISPECGDPTTCEPFATNPPLAVDGGVENFRMRLISLTAPASLASTVVQGGVVTPAVDLPIVDGGPSCGENGTGLFNWLLTVDKSHHTVTTGGAPPSSDPYKTGYCYLHAFDGDAAIGPETVDASFVGCNNFNSTAIKGLLNIPIFLPSAPGAPLAVVLLPIRGAAFNDVTISENGNCIGSVNNNSIAPANGGCVDPEAAGVSSCSRWHTAGSFSGYITLKEADGVYVATLGESLCVLLTGLHTGSGGKCPSSAYNMGNFCSTTLQPGGCNDSYWLSAQFAASAVNIIKGDSGVALCSGEQITPKGG